MTIGESEREGLEIYPLEYVMIFGTMRLLRVYIYRGDLKSEYTGWRISCRESKGYLQSLCYTGFISRTKDMCVDQKGLKGIESQTTETSGSTSPDLNFQQELWGDRKCEMLRQVICQVSRGRVFVQVWFCQEMKRWDRMLYETWSIETGVGNYESIEKVRIVFPEDKTRSLMVQVTQNP